MLYPRFTKLEGLLRIDELKLPHPNWKFVTLGSEPEAQLNQRLQSKTINADKLALSDKQKWTVRTCLLGNVTEIEFGLKRAVGIDSNQVADKLKEFREHYDRQKLHVVFVIYPYFLASKSGIIELHSFEIMLESVSGSQWRLTEEGAPSESWTYEGPHDKVSVSKFRRKSDQEMNILTLEEVERLSTCAIAISDNDVLLEWTITPDETLLFYDMRPVASRGMHESKMMQVSPDLVGSGASPGLVTGKVRVSAEASQIDYVKPGEILVLKTLTRDLARLIPKMPTNTGIIAETGGTTSHPAIVSREFGIPMIVGLKEASRILNDGEVLTMDGSTGRVYLGEHTSWKPKF